MAFDTSKLSYFHSFSKLPVDNDLKLNNAINKSGHTVTSSEVWANDIPYYGKMGSLDDVISKIQPNAQKNDMCFITSGKDMGKTFQYDGNNNWIDITSTLIDGAIIKNSKDEPVLLFHKGIILTNLTADNNANVNSNNNAARLRVTRDKKGNTIPNGGTRLVEQFVQVTDKSLDGRASVAYAPILTDKATNASLISETDYYDYCFSGTILWEKVTTKDIKIDCFEYIGKYVSDVSGNGQWNDDKIFDLNQFIVNHISTHKDDTDDWVRTLVKSNMTYIPHRQTFYANSESMSDAKDEWIEEAKTGNVSVQLVFPYDSWKTNQVIRLMFWQLDQDNGFTYGSDESISKQFMKPGLTVRYFTFLDDGNWHDYNDYDYDTKFEEIDKDTDAKTFYPSYTFQTWIGNSKFSKDRGDTLINWNSSTTTSFNPDSYYTSGPTDAFMRAYNWTFTANEQQIKQIKEAIIDNSESIEALRLNTIESLRLKIIENNWGEQGHIFDNTSGYGDSVGEVQLSSDYFMSGKIDSISIPYDNVSNWGNNTSVFLMISVCDSNNTEIAHFISKNSDVYNTNKSNYKFDFDNCVIPDEYSYVKISASSVNSKENRNYQEFRVIALRNSNGKDDKISKPNCKFSWLKNGELNGGADGRVASLNFIRYISNEVQTDITEDVTEDSYSIGTTKAIKDYINQLESHEEWHKSKKYSHIITDDGLSNLGQLSSMSNAVGQSVYGLVFSFPIGVKINTINVSTVLSYGNVLTDGVGKYAKVWNYATKELICTSYEGKRPLDGYGNEVPNSYNILFDFYRDDDKNSLEDTKKKTLYCLPNLKYIITFHNTEDSTEPIAYNVAYNTANGVSFVQHYFSDKNLEQEKVCPTLSGSYTVNGFVVRFISSSVINKEFTDIEHELSNLYNISNSNNAFEAHINNTDIHFSKNLIYDTIQIPTEHVKDLSDATKNTAVENIAYAQICEPTYNFSKNCFLKSVTVPQDYSTTNYTQENIYLVMYGDTLGGNTDGVWEFMACSKNSQLQQAGGEDMVFEFEEIDLGDYKRCRFFYSRTNEGEIPLPEIGANFSGVKMAFTTRNIDTNCWVLTADNRRTFNNTFPAIISYVTYEISSVLHKENDVRHITQEERERWNNSAGVQTGINIGTEDNLITPTARIANEGFLKGVTAINFRGAFVNVVKKDDKTIDVWINEDNNCPEASTASSEGVTTKTKYVFGSSTNAWELPVDNGKSFTSCHPITEDQKITIKGTKKGITCNPVSVKNLTSKIRVEVYGKNNLIKSYQTPNYITRSLPVKDDSELGSSLSSSQGGITISITNLKRYCDVDESGLGWDASNGYIPDTVSFNCSITLDTSEILPDGGVYEVRVYLDTYDDDGNLNKSTTLHDGEIYYAYKKVNAIINGKPSVEIQTINGVEQIKTRWVSGVEYIAKDTKFKVTYQQMQNTTYMAADYETKRGSVSLSDCTCDGSSDITGSTGDKENTKISVGTKTFTLSANNSVLTSLTATQTAYSVDDNTTPASTTYEPANGMKIWATGTEDTYNTAYFENEQTDDEGENKGYGRILGHIDGNTLVIDSETFDSKQNYANQAKVYNGTLVYGSGSGTKYYVRKFKKNNTDNASQLKGFYITIPGIIMDSDKMEVWYFMIDDQKLGLSRGQKISASSPDGIGELDKNDSNKVYAVINANALPVVPNDNEDFYIVIVLKDNTVSITGDIIIS